MIDWKNNNVTSSFYTLIVCLVCLMFFLLTEPFWPRIADIFLFINQSRPHHNMHIMTEYFIDSEKYFYLILLHMTIAVCIGMTVMVATVSLLIGCIQYFCAMFKIARWSNKCINLYNNPGCVCNTIFLIEVREEPYIHNYIKSIIYSYRIEQAMTIGMLENISLKNDMICRKIICAVDIHRKAMELVFIWYSRWYSGIH